MKRNKLVLTIALTSICISGTAHGEGSASRTTPGTVTPNTTAPVATAPATSTTAGAGYIMPSGGGNAADSGRKAQTGQLIGAAINIGAATMMYMPICRTKYGAWACPLAALAASAANTLGKASGGSGYAGGQMSAYTGPTIDGLPPAVDQNGNPINYGGGPGGDGTNGGPGTNGTNGGLPTPATIAGDVARIRTELEKSGVQISDDGKTLTTKDGRKFDLSKAGDGSAQDLQAMGLTAGEANNAVESGRKFGNAMGAKYASMLKGADGGGGGGGGSAGRGPASDGGGGGAGGFGGWGKDPFGKNRPKAKISGLTRKLGDDTIGVAGDDIFEMVTRRYKARDEINQFIKD